MFKALRSKKSKEKQSSTSVSLSEEQVLQLEDQNKSNKNAKRISKFIATNANPKSIIRNTGSSLGSISSSTNSSLSKHFNLYQISHYGLEGKIIQMAYDQPQSLLAVVTNLNELVIYGKNQVEAHIPIDSLENNAGEGNPAFVTDLKFVKGIYLIVVDSKSCIHIVSVLSNKVLTTFYSPGHITAMETDPTLNWILVGLEDGSVRCYDVDKNHLSLVSIENIQKQHFFKSAQISSVTSLCWNPRTIGQVLISYNYVSVLYNIMEGTFKMEFIYSLPAGAPGGGYMLKNDTTTDINEVRYPKVLKSVFHPNGLHLVTLHDDNSIVFWDSKTGKLIFARNLYDANVNKPGTILSVSSKDSNFPISPIIDIKWVTGESSENTQLLIIGGDIGNDTPHSFTVIDLGGTPLYSVSSYDKMKNYYSIRNNQKIINLPPDKKFIQVLPIPRNSPFYNGNHNPGILLILYDTGELDTMLYPTGKLTYKSSLLPQSLSWLRPFSNLSTGVAVPTKTWIGMMHTTYNKDSLLKGGETVNTKVRQLSGFRTAIVTAHDNGSIRLWDGSHSELTETSVFDINLSNILNLGNHVTCNHISYAPHVGELAVAVKETGDVVLLKFDLNKFYNEPLTSEFARFNIKNLDNSLLIDIANRSPKNLRNGFMPQTVVHAKSGEVTCLKHSSIGFVMIGYSNGSMLVVDKRGPAVIFFHNIKNLMRECDFNFTPGEIITVAEFGIMQIRNDKYSSIVLSCGTSSGNLLQFCVVPGVSGRFTVDLLQIIPLSNTSITTILYLEDNADSSTCLRDTPQLFGNLSKGSIYVGKMIAITHEGEIASLSSIGLHNKVNKRSYKSQQIASSNIVNVSYVNSKHERKQKAVLISLLMDRSIVISNCSDFKEIKTINLKLNMTARNLYNSKVLENGDIILRTGHTMAYVYSVVEGLNTSRTLINDQLYQVGVKIPERPYYNSLQWARGEQNVAPKDIDVVLGGAKYDRISKYEESNIANASLTSKGEQPRKISGGKFDLENHSYTPPTRNGAKQGYSYMKAVSKAVENGYDGLETKVNDYASQTGQALSDSMEKSTMELSKGLFKSTFGV
ncbi:hypothetical protein QEN19_003510 [Hanseniaspora menglaensis]